MTEEDNKMIASAKARIDEPASPRTIELNPVIASYSGTSYRAIKGYLDRRVLDLIARVALAPVSRAEIDPETSAELIEMHVFKEVDEWIRLDTAVFLENDLEQITCFASDFGKELAGLVARSAAPLRSEPPVIVNFSVGIIGLVQSLGHYLTDAYALHLTGQLAHPAMHNAAEQAGLFRDGQMETAVLTNDSLEKYLPTIQKVGDLVREYYLGKLGEMEKLLLSTAAGRQGVPAGHMSLHLWRYLRRAVAQELYTTGVFTDRVPETGQITIFFENNVEILNELFG